jgi:hypothetical protein
MEADRAKAPSRYLRSKAAAAARVLTLAHGMEYGAALRMTEALWREARTAILRAATADEWQGLSLGDKAAICGAVIRGLLDRKAIAAFLSGEARRIA